MSKNWRLYLLFALFAALLVIMAGCGPDPFFVSVMSIEDVPETGTVGKPLTLTARIKPGFASKSAVTWLVRDAGATGAVVNGNVLTTDATGTVLLRAAVINGMADGRDYTQDFKIVIREGLPVYTVHFETNGGNFIPDQAIEAGQKAERPHNPAKSGYSFVDWYDNEAFNEPPYGFNTPITGNITLYAQWSRDIYTYPVTFNSNGGNEIPGQHIIGDGKVSKPTDPYKNGYNFGGWYKESALITEWNFTADTVTAGITLYARWIAVYTVTFDAHGGITPPSLKVEDGGKAARPQNDPVRPGYDFVDWYADPGLTTIYNFGSPVTGNITLYAKWIEHISVIELYITGPMKGERPDPAASVNGIVSYTAGAVSWSPVGDSFLGSTEYTATVTVTANTGSKFIGTLTAAINGHPATITNGTDTTVTLTHTFDRTPEKAVNKIEIQTQPTYLKYTHGDALDLTGLSVILTHDDNTTEIVKFADFGDIIYANPPNGETLSRTLHNGKPVKVSTGIHNAYTDVLTVNKATPVIAFPIAAPIIYEKSLSQSTLTGGSSTPPGSFDWQDGAVIPPVNNSGYPVEFTPEDPADTENYDYSLYGTNWNGAKVTQIVAIDVSKAKGRDVGTPIITGDAKDLSITVTPLTLPVSMQTIEYAINTTNTAPVSGWQDETIFDGLALDTTYSIFARSKANENYDAGTASVSNATVAFYTVTFDSKGGSAAATQTVLSGAKATKPADPVNGLYYFDGWYKEEAFTTKWDFTADTVTASITLYAKWIQNTVTITLNMEQITNSDPAIGDITVSRTGSSHPVTAEVSIDAGKYDPGSIKWEIAGVGVYANETINGYAAAFTINAADKRYNTLGGHVLKLEVKKDGTTYRVNINFYIVN